jgi:hypothetical protein
VNFLVTRARRAVGFPTVEAGVVSGVKAET